MAGTLILVGTPIGNLKDASERARETLARVDLIACEDTRRTGRLLQSLRIQRRARLVSYFEGNERRQTPYLIEQLQRGSDVALVTDGGMPAVSDPGFRLVRAAIAAGIEVDVVPGPAAAIAALVVSGLPTDRFAFEGFLPRKARVARLQELAGDPRTLLFFESPQRLRDMLRDAARALGPDRPAAVVRELTKLHQEIRRGTLGELADATPDEVKGEVTVVVGGAEPAGPDLTALASQVN
ncbi:MAG TPA: 16S rRNA (cytidine(1402)-2'-O)-methyltransferase, partial [Actinomycetota bacterium]